jgi:polyhydroxybutyrate depolymerase
MNRIGRARLGILGMWLILAASGAAAAQRETRNINVHGQPREYLLASPDSSRSGRRPLVLVLHGHLGTAANAMGQGVRPSPLSVWLEVVDRDGILVAALQGLKGSDERTGWHDCRSDNSSNPASDDVAFANAVVAELVAAGRVDARRVYVMGMSNGAMMSFRLALEMQPAPAAIAAAAGTMAAHSNCRSAMRPVSVLIIHGTEDPLVPYGGGSVGLGKMNSGTVIGVAASRDLWLSADGLGGAAPVETVMPHLGSDSLRASRQTWGVDTGPQVEVVTIEHGGHVEPSKRFHYGPAYTLIVGPQSRDLESVEEAWAFFRNKVRD